MKRSAGLRAKARPPTNAFLLKFAVSTILGTGIRFLILNRVSYEPSIHYRDVINPSADSKPFIAIVSCIKSKPDWFRYRPEELLKERLLPSIHATVSEDERSKYRIEVIFGYDDDDEFWKQQSNQEILIANSDRTQQPIPVTFISLPKDKNKPNRIPFNELCQAAYERGVTYLVRINDDTHFITQNWLTLAIQKLQSFSPPNVGVVGPSCKGDASSDREILTHDMTYLPYHLAIFGTYYPSIFDNYYIDDWISRVYGIVRTKRLGEWEVVHDIQAFGTRYRPSFSQDQYLEGEIAKGKVRVQKFVAEMIGAE